MMWGYATLVLCVLASVWCGPLPDEDTSWYLGLKMAYGTYQQCKQQEDIFSCLKMRALRFMDRAIQKDSIPLLEGVTLVKTPDESRSIPETLPSTEVVESALPSDSEDRHDYLNELIIERIRLFMTTHSLQLNMPRYMNEAEEVPLDTFLEEGRDKKKKKKKKAIAGIVALAVIAKLLLLKGIGVKLVGLLAAKALLVSKLALVLAVAALLLKILSKAGAAAGGGGGGGGGDGGDKTTYEIIKVPYIAHADGGHDHGGGGGGYGGGGSHYDSSGGGGGGHHYDSSGGGGGGGYGGGWGRSALADAHMLAYRAHVSQGAPSPKLI